MEREKEFRADACLILSYGGPEREEEVGPFLDRLLAGKPIRPERRAAVEEKYRFFSGKSPLNGEIRRFTADLAVCLAEIGEKKGRSLPVYAGNLYAAPLLDDALTRLAADGRRRIRVFIAGAFGSPSSCLRYRAALTEALRRFERSCSESQNSLPDWRFSFVEPFFDNPLFRRAAADSLLSGYAQLLLEQGFSDNSNKNEIFVLFSAHALPLAESEGAFYERQLLSVCESVAAVTGLGQRRQGISSDDLGQNCGQNFGQNLEQTSGERNLSGWNLVYQSRSGRPDQPWNVPEIGEFLKLLKEKAPFIKKVLLVPIGFFFENMETVGDLDREFALLCADCGIGYHRASAVGNTPEAVRMAAQLLTEGPAAGVRLDSLDACTDCRLRCKNGKQGNIATF